MMTEAQKQALAAALRAGTDAGVVAMMAIRNDVGLAEWCNAASSNTSRPGATRSMAGCSFRANTASGTCG